MNKKLFDPKYIYSTWDDSLKGKEVFYDDTIGNLEHEVQNFSHCNGKVVGHNVDDDDKPFVVEGICNALTNWRYVYYDPNYATRVAYYRDGKVEGICNALTNWRYVYYDPNYATRVAYYRDGKQVQFKSHETNTWENCDTEPGWMDNYEWRVKPEEHVVQATEFPRLCGYCIHRKDGCTPDSTGNCVNFFSTNDDYFRVKEDYVDLVKEHVELEHKYGAIIAGIQQLMHGPVNC